MKREEKKGGKVKWMRFSTPTIHGGNKNPGVIVYCVRCGESTRRIATTTNGTVVNVVERERMRCCTNLIG